MKSFFTNLIKDIYLFGIRKASNLSHKKHKKVVFLLSFPTTSSNILEALYQEYTEDLIICYTKHSSKLANHYKGKKCEVYLINRYDVLIKKIIPYVTGAQVILCDNYFAFLAGINFDRKAKVVQLWHANGAIKKFGLEAQYAKKSSGKNQRRYKKVYQKFTHYVVSSRKMKEVFEKNFQQSIVSLNFGYPQTDNYLNSKWKTLVKDMFQTKFPTNKKILLYAPTYREAKDFKIIKTLNILKKLNDEWLVIVKMHPHDEMRYELSNVKSELVFDLRGLSLSEILPSIDCLVTDYSSIPFEYTLANPNGKIVFYCYDYKQYENEVGIEQGFMDWAPGVFANDETTLISAVNKNMDISFDDFNQIWNEYATGQSKEQIIEWVKKNNE